MIARTIAPLFNSEGLHDAAGAFQPEAKAFAKMHGGAPTLLFDNKADMPHRKTQVGTWLRRQKDLADVVAFFCHGWPDGIQAGWHRSDVADLAEALHASCLHSPTVLLDCCLTAADGLAATSDVAPGAGGDGGFADELRDACLRVGLRATIFAHSTKGHTSRNQYVRRFGPETTRGGEWVIEPGSELWPAWQHALQHTDLRLRFWALTPEQLRAELGGLGAVA